jgi:iron complex outermembrane receptor protein
MLSGSGHAWAQTEIQDSASPEGAGEIVVTAQRRVERLTDVPISITALTGDALAASGIRSTEDLSAVVPGLNFATNGAFAQPTVRGIGTTVSAAGSDANVAIYIDSVYQPSQIGNFSSLVDIEQIEVLKGPQGTLFGRNATGGAIRITTRRPTFEPTGDLMLSYGSFDEIRGSAYGSAGLSDTVAASLAFFYSDDRGYTRNIATGGYVAATNAVMIRGKVLFVPSDGLEFTLSGMHSERDANAPFSLGVLNRNNNNLGRAGILATNNPREVSLTFDPAIGASSDLVSLNGKIDLGFADLTSISSYQRTKTYLLTDTDRTNLALNRADLPGGQKTYTQELNLVSSGKGPFQWFLGAFYYNDDATGATIVNNGAVFTAIRLKSEAIAPFGEANLTLGDLTLIAGLRYNHERKNFTATRGTIVEQRSQTFNNLTPRLGARYALGPSANLYATWSRGFKSGLFDQVLVGSTLVVSPVQPEKVDAYEIGFKYGRGRTSLSASGFIYDYDNIQFQAFNPNGGGLTQVFNAAKARVYGGEIEASVSPANDFNLRATAAYTHSEYRSFPNATIYCPIGAPTFGNRSIALGAVNPCTGRPSAGASGNQLIRTPEFTASLSSDYHLDLGSGAIDLSATASYSGPFYWDPGNRLREAAYVLVNGEITYAFPGDKLRVTLWGRNLLNEGYSIYVTEAAAGDSVAYARPRTIGVSARLSFR